MRPSPLLSQTNFSSVAMTRSGLSLEELRIVEGQGQSSEIITPPEEINRMNDLGKRMQGVAGALWKARWETASGSFRKDLGLHAWRWLTPSCVLS